MMFDAQPARETVHVLAWRLVDYDGGEMTYGGLQRWVLELTALLNAMGHPVLVHQRARRAFEKELQPGLRVVGHRASTRAAGSPWFNVIAHRAIPAGAPVVYMAEDLAWPVCRPRSVVIQHGIWWDGEYGWWKTRLAERVSRNAVRGSAAVVCVDTNYINWLRARWPESGFDRRLHYVPNFIDPASWGPQPSVPAALARPKNRLVVCFPRRSEPRRGIWLMADVVPRLAARFPETDFRFIVGSGYHTEQLRRRLEDSDLARERWSLESLPFERMREAYEQSAIVVVPTVCGEGTSLSAIEAMYFGCGVVSTWVGGLPNLIQDGFNGRLVAPVASDLEEALAGLISDPASCAEMGRNAMKSAVRLYGIERWRPRVREIVVSALRLESGLESGCEVRRA
jgi:glycosyltransferase involved in cell wall biosynthesis